MDMGASVIARLKNKAKETGKPFQLHLQLFCQEEFLRRLPPVMRKTWCLRAASSFIR